MLRILFIFLFSQSILVYGQVHQWAFDIKSNGVGADAIIRAQAVDDSSNVYLAGVFIGDLYLGTDTFTRSLSSTRAPFLAKYDKDGNYIWGKAFTTAQSANIKDIVINSQKQIILFGDYRLGSTGSLSFGSQSLTRSAGVFVAFMNSSGTFTSAKDLGYAGFVSASDIALGPNDEIHASMYLNGFSSRWNVVNGNRSVSGSGNFVHIVAKYNDAATSLNWHKSYAISQVTSTLDLDVDKDGNVFYPLTMADNATVHGISSTSTNKRSLLVWRKANGSFYKTIATSAVISGFGAYSAINNIEVRDSNTIYFTGASYGDSITVNTTKIYSLTTDPRKVFNFVGEIKNFDSISWHHSATHQGFGTIGSSNLSTNGDFLYFSFLQNTPSFSFAGFSSSSFTRCLVTKFDRLGNQLWFLNLDAAGPAYMDGIGGQDLLYSGGYANIITLSPFSFSSIGATRPFVARTFDYSITRGDVISGPYCAGDTILVPYERAGDFDSSNTFIAELSDEKGDFFGGQRELGRLKYDGDSTIIGKLPLFQVASSNKYRIRIRSTNPVVQSYYRLDTLSLLIYSTDDADPGPDTSICYGDTIELSTFGGTTWSWSPKYNMIDSTSRTPLVFPKVDTLYQIIIGDSSGCGAPDTADIRILINSSPIFQSQSQSDTMVCAKTDVTFRTTFSEGIGSYYVNWYRNGELVQATSTQSFSDSLNIQLLIDSDIIAVLTDSCSSLTDTAFFKVQLPDSMVVDTLPPDTLACVGEKLDFFASASHLYQDRITYIWRNGRTVISNDSVLSFQPSSSRLLRLTIDNSCNAETVNHTFTVNTRDPLGIAISSSRQDDTLCANGDVQFVADVAGGKESTLKPPQWIISKDTFFGDTINLKIETLLTSNPDVFDFEIMAIADDGCTALLDTAETDFKVYRPLRLDSLSDFDTLLCEGIEQRVVAYPTYGQQPYDFQWKTSKKNTGTGGVFVLSKLGFSKGNSMLKVRVSDRCNSSDSLITTVLVPEDLEVSIDGDSILCNGQGGLLMASAGGGLPSNYTFDWNYNGQSASGLDSLLIEGVSHNLFQDSVIDVAVQLSDGCMTAIKDSVSFRVQPKVVISLTEDSLSRRQFLDTTICRGEKISFRQKSFFLTNGNTSWWLDGSEVSRTNDFIFDQSFQMGKARYTLLAIAYDSCSMSGDTTTVSIELREPLSLEKIADTILCQGEDIIFRASASGGLPTSYNFEWRDYNNSTIVLSTENTLTLNEVSKSRTISLLLNDGCTLENDSVRINISVRDPLDVQISSSDNCTNNPISLAALGSGGKVADYQYQWYADNVSIDNGQQITVSPGKISTYKVVLNDGCSVIGDSSSLDLGPKPSFEINPIDSDCEPLDVIWDPTSLNDDQYTYQRIDVKTTEEYPITSSNSFLAGEYDYWIISTDQLGCKDSVRSFFVVKSLPDPSFTWTPEEADFDQNEITFSALDSVTSYYWELENKVGDDSVFVVELNEVGEYEVKLIVELDGCFDSLTERVYFKDAFRYYEVSSFSPNSDGLNDLYKPYVLGVKSLDYQIYNRWGQLIYVGTLEGNGWDGTYQGLPVAQGDYLVLLNYEKNNNQRIYTKSLVKVLR